MEKQEETIIIEKASIKISAGKSKDDGNRENKMVITYLYHSGFAVELDKHVLLFDYYTGDAADRTKQERALPEWSREKQIYVFISHKHRDHFDMAVFQLAEVYPQIHYFLGSDVKLSERYLERNGVSAAIKAKLTNIGKGRQLVYGDIKIETLRSTDAGVAFIVEAEGELFYHAGDLNWWHWEGETALYNENMKRAYQKEIDMLADRRFTAAFVPLDPRLGKAYRYGMDYFLSKVYAAHVFPMHMWEQYDWIKRYKTAWKEESFCEIDADRIDAVMEIGHACEQFQIDT